MDKITIIMTMEGGLDEFEVRLELLGTLRSFEERLSAALCCFGNLP